jgi:translation initiation factor 2B subunit (eIF-2B alpha/beta/delta family)
VTERREASSPDIGRIASDNLHGAAHLARMAARAVRKIALEGATAETLRRAAVEIAQAQPTMAPLFDFANRLLFLLDETAERERVADFCDGYLLAMERASEAAAERAAAIVLRSTVVLTHSASSLVREALIEARRRGGQFRVICTESRPAGEGVGLAEALCGGGIETALVTDAAAGYMMEEADLFLVGADGIGRFGLVHKIGTWPMALAARARGVPFTVVATSQKLWPPAVKEVREPLKDGGEITPVEGCFEKINRYFDITPLEGEDSVVTEHGVSKGREILNLLEARKLHPRLEREGSTG